MLNCIKSGSPSELRMNLAANMESPPVNPAFVINCWGGTSARLMIDNKEIKPGKDFRPGHRRRIEGTDLIVWVE